MRIGPASVPKRELLISASGALFGLALGAILVAIPSVQAQTNMAPGAPTAVAAYSTTSQNLEIRWSSSDFAVTTGFKVQWKSGSQNYDSSRQTSVDPATSLVSDSSTTSSRRYKYPLTGLMDNTQYTVQIIASNTHGDSSPSPEVTGTPASTPGQAREFVENEVVNVHESDFPWLRQTLTYLTDQNKSVVFGSVSVAISFCSPFGDLFACQTNTVQIDRSDAQLIRTITHELAHAYTLSNLVTTDPGPLGVAHVYFSKLEVQDSNCRASELYADVVMILVHGQGAREQNTYWSRCIGENDNLTEEALAVLRSAVAGDMPSWMATTYTDVNARLDLESLWTDVKALSGNARRVAAFQLRDEFGGYCDYDNAAESAFGSGVTRNPWEDGGCVPQPPSDVGVDAISNGKLVVTWVKPTNDGGSPIEGYKVQWQRGFEDYAQAVITDLANLSYTTPSLILGLEYGVRVLAYNVNGDGNASADVDVTATDENAQPDFPPTEDGRRSLAENTGPGVNVGAPVAAGDLDGDALTYTLSGTDVDAFEIVPSSGQLRTKSALDFEAKARYEVTVSVHDGKNIHGGPDATTDDTISVTITVTDVNEVPAFPSSETGQRSVAENTGARVNIGAPVAAEDDDNDPLTYTLGGADVGVFDFDTSSGQLRTKAALDHERKASYRVTVTAREASGATAAITVTISVTDVNEAPAFPVTETGQRSVAETAGAGVDIGPPVAAADDDQDALIYTLSGSDAGVFEIVGSSGQVRTREALDFEVQATYFVIVTVHDGKGSDGLPNTAIDDTIAVTITVTDVNEAPAFFGSETGQRSVVENTQAGVNIGAPVAAEDDDNDALIYTLSGSDASAFEIVGSSSQLRTKAPLDFEAQATYAVTVTVSDGKRADGTPDTAIDASLPVMITLTNVEESGTVNLSAQPQVDTALTASLSDPDGSVSGLAWTWERSSNQSAWTTIGGATSAIYTPVTGDLNYYLRATAAYTDGEGAGKSARAASAARVQAATANNRAPQFPATETGARSVAENTAAGVDIGAPVVANDPDNDPLTYTLGGADAAVFDFDTASGQLRTKAALDHERKGSYGVTVTARDLSGATAAISVTITVDDVNEAPAFPLTETGQRSVAETAGPGGDIGVPVAAADDDNDALTYALSGADAGSFAIVASSGQLQTDAALDVEARATYFVIVTVHDGKGPDGLPNTAIDDSITVTITVTDVNEAPAFLDSETGQRSVAENTLAGVDIGPPVAAADGDYDALTYALGGRDAGAFEIVGTWGQLLTRAALDFEAKATYAITVSVRDGRGVDGTPDTAIDASIPVTITVTNVEEAGTVSLLAPPQADTELTATLSDPDGSVADLTWTWERSSNRSVWTVISGATPATYTPVVGDLGQYLRVTAAYTDGEGAGKSARDVSVDPVQPYRSAPPPPPRPPPPPPPPPGPSGPSGTPGPRAPSVPAVPAAPQGVIGGTPAATATELPGNRLLIQRHDVPDASFELAIGSISADGISVVMAGVIRDETLGQTYLVVRRAADGRIVRRWVLPYSPFVYQIPWAVVNSRYNVPVGVVGAIPLDDQFPEPNLLVRRFDGGDDRIFGYDANLQQWRHVPDIPTFQMLGFYWCNVTAADATFFQRLTTGPPYPASDTTARDDYPNCLTS